MPEPPFRVAFLADMQLGLYASFSGMNEGDVVRYAEMDMRIDAVPATDGFDWDARQYQRAVEMLNHLAPDLVIVGGDMIDDPNAEEQIETFLGITAGLDPAIPMRYAPGNHDVAADTVVPTEESIAHYREVFGADYYTFSAGPATFLVLNTVVIDHPELVPAVWEEQQAFIADAFDGPRPGNHLVVVGHHPLFLSDPDEPDTYWNLPLERRRPLYDSLRAAGVRLGLSGHWHRNNIAVHDGFEMVCSGPVGYPLGADPSGLRLVEVYPDRIAHTYLPLGE